MLMLDEGVCKWDMEYCKRAVHVWIGPFAGLHATIASTEFKHMATRCTGLLLHAWCLQMKYTFEMIFVDGSIVL